MVWKKIFEQFTKALFHFPEIGFVHPEGVIGIECNDLDVFHFLQFFRILNEDDSA